ncbi:MAG: YidC/Oxa1 family membrane protein insertase [Actinomycetota bacterium]|nr:YidC/Oxa1 family membrane protein insertase [Actinomycetota bacterium]
MEILDGLSELVARILAFFYQLPVVGDNYGLAIILLTFFVMICLMPLTLKATRSTIRMQQIQPELRRVQKEFKNDREQMNAELMKLYSQHGINPVGGCLPMLAQMPVFLVLFQILRGLTTRVEEQPFFSVANKIRVAAGEAPANGRLFDPQHLSENSQLYNDLRTDEEMNFGPLDLAAHTFDVVKEDFLRSLPYLVLILVMVALSFYQQHQITARRPGTAELSPMMQQQQQIMRFLPLITGVWAFVFPTGLVLYWTTSSVFRIGQQAYIGKRIYGAADLTESGTGDDDGAAEATAVSSSNSDVASKEKGKESKTPPSATKPDASDGTAPASDRALRAAARQAEWEARRSKAPRKKAGTPADAPPSRLTPKGTQPGASANRDKRKKKR